MRTLAILLNGCFYFGILGEAIEVNIDTFTSARMSSFVKHKWHYLEASKLMVLNASDFADCAMECLKLLPTCLSLNMASSPDEEEILRCELLLSDMYNNSVNLRENALSHHYSKLTPCLKSPCQNGGVCTPLYDEDSHKCDCKTGLTGKNCEINIDDCTPYPCSNGATCEDQVNNYTCTCVVGFYGRHCTINPDDCASSPCQYDGTCTDGLDDYSCACPAGTAGKSCEINFDECSPNPCVNGATCTDELNDYSCTCVVGYWGKNCSIECDVNDGWVMFNSYCYKYIAIIKSWQDAKTYCSSLNSKLLTIHSQAENDFAHSLIPEDGKNIWLGANDLAVDGVWVWEDGIAWGSYTGWVTDSSEPNGGSSENCVMMYKSGKPGLWNDASCSGMLHYVCKK